MASTATELAAAAPPSPTGGRVELHKTPPRPPCIAFATLEQLEAERPPRRLQQLLALDARVFGSGAGDPLAGLRGNRSARAALAHVAGPGGGDDDAPMDGEPELRLAGYALYTTMSLAVHVSRVAVAPDARRRGVGLTLLEACLRQGACERRVRCASLHVDPTNAAAVALYCRAGFVVEAQLPDYFGPGRGAVRMVSGGDDGPLFDAG